MQVSSILNQFNSSASVLTMPVTSVHHFLEFTTWVNINENYKLTKSIYLKSNISCFSLDEDILN